MSYVDAEYYKNVYCGSTIPDDTLENKLDKASDNIDSLTFNRINGVGFDSLTPFQQDRIKKAVCVHADFIEKYGEYINTPLSGFSAGSVSLNFNTQKINGVTTTPDVFRYLNQTGLTCRRL